MTIRYLGDNIVEVKNSTIPNGGRGLFSKINTDEFDIGMILTRFEFDDDEPFYYDDTNICNSETRSRSRYSIQFNNGKCFYLTPNPTKLHMLGNYTNESRGNNTSNSYISTRYYKNKPYGYIRLLTKLSIGDEILCDYGNLYKEIE